MPPMKLNEMKSRFVLEAKISSKSPREVVKRHRNEICALCVVCACVRYDILIGSG